MKKLVSVILFLGISIAFCGNSTATACPNGIITNTLTSSSSLINTELTGNNDVNINVSACYNDIIESDIRCFQDTNNSTNICPNGIESTTAMCPNGDYRQISSKFYLLSKYSTSYETSTAERSHNVELAVKSIDGKLIMPNEEFTFNGVVGRRTVQKGYKEAPIIVDSQYINGLGGGVCQVSTTLYNSVILGELEVMECHHHSLPPHYVEPSFDAMVSYSTADFRFKNTTGGYVYIKAWTSNNTIHMELYSNKKPSSNVELVTRSEIVEVLPYEEELIYDCDESNPHELQIGEQKIEHYGKNGIKSQGYIEKWQDGKLISSKKIRTDTYRPQTQVVIVRSEYDN